MTRAETIRKFPKSGWRNLLARHLAGMTKRPAPTEFLEYQTQTTLHLPFAGEWYVYWGGRSVAWNRHVVVRDQRFAYDFLILARGHCRAVVSRLRRKQCGVLLFRPTDLCSRQRQLW